MKKITEIHWREIDRHIRNIAPECDMPDSTRKAFLALYFSEDGKEFARILRARIKLALGASSESMTESEILRTVIFKILSDFKLDSK